MNKQLLSTFLTLCLCGGGAALALDKPGAPQPVPAPADATARHVAAETISSIAALGANPSAKQISAIVFNAVRSSPDNVLVIVDAAARVSPKPAVPEIVIAAIAAVPIPWKQVTYRRLTALRGPRSEPDYKSGPDGKQARDGGPAMDLGGRAAGDRGVNFANGNVMTLAEAIALTAFDAQPGLSFASLQTAVDTALRMDPASLLRNILSPRTVSGVGDAGLSNYANEPLRTPNQPVVSR